MPFSHHSHSGQFCPGHAANTLEEMVQAAIAKKMTIFGLTEHMPRDEIDAYPEEKESQFTAQTLLDLIDGFYKEAVHLREKYASQIKILIGFECEWIRASSLALIKTLRRKYDFDYFVGSVHHVFTIPIDYDKTKYDEARKLVGGTDEELFAEYFDAQHAMLTKLKPAVVGHFDLIRLYSDQPNASLKQYEGVWDKVLRNLKVIIGYGGLVELNSSALRKGLDEPYPKREICEVFLAMGGKFTLSDDSHGVLQVGLNYYRMLEAIRTTGIQEIHYLEKNASKVVLNGNTNDDNGVTVGQLSLAELEDHPFWGAEIPGSTANSDMEPAT